MVEFKIHWINMMSVPESRAAVGRADGINGRDRPEDGCPEENLQHNQAKRIFGTHRTIERVRYLTGLHRSFVQP
jgi:hypothetical protein